MTDGTDRTLPDYTSASLAETYPEIINFAPQCRMCRLARGTDAERRALREAHDAVLRGRPRREITLRVQEVLGLGVVSSGGVTRHFQNHCSVGAQTISEVAAGRAHLPDPAPTSMPPPLLFPGVKTLPPPAVMNAAPPVYTASPTLDDEGDDEVEAQYDQAWGLYRKVYDLLASFDSQKLIQETEKGEMLLSTPQVKAWTTLVDTGRKLLADIHRVQTDRHLLDTALRAHQRRLVLAIIGPIQLSLVPLIEELRLGHNADRVAGKLEQLLRDGLIDQITDAAQTALQESRSQFRIVNSEAS